MVGGGAGGKKWGKAGGFPLYGHLSAAKSSVVRTGSIVTASNAQCRKCVLST